MFFFEHKTADEKRISDWSSDVCSADLQNGKREGSGLAGAGLRDAEQILALQHIGNGLGLNGGGGFISLRRKRLGNRIGKAEFGKSFQNTVFQTCMSTHHCRAADGFRAHGMNGLVTDRSEEHTSELQSLMRISYAVFCLKKNKQQ